MRERFRIRTSLIDLRGLDNVLRYPREEKGKGEHGFILDQLIERGYSFASGGRQRPIGTIIAISVETVQ